MRHLPALPLLLVPLAVHAASCPGAPAGVRDGQSIQIFSGSTPQIYRICKGEPLHGGDCDIEVRNESNAPIAVLGKQPMNSCACTDVEGKKIPVAAVASSGPACSAVSTTVWFSNAQRDNR